MKNFISTAILFLTLIFSNALFARVYYVNGSYTGSTANGNSWTTPFKKLELAIAAATDGDEIWVAKGTYVAPISPKSSGYYINNGITIYGGFAGTETSIYARNLELNKTIMKASATTEENYQVIFRLKPNKPFGIDGLNFTNFGSAIYAQRDTIIPANGTNLQVGDRYKITIKNAHFYSGSLPVSLGYYTDLLIKDTKFDNVNPIIISEEDLHNADPLFDFSMVTFENIIFTAPPNSYPPPTTQFNRVFFNAINCTYNNYVQSTIQISESRDITLSGCIFNNTKQIISCTGTKLNIQINDCIIDGFGNDNNIINFSDNNSSLRITNTTFKNGVKSYQIASDLKNVELDNVTFINTSFNNQAFRNINILKIKNSLMDGLNGGTSDYAFFCDANGDLEVDNTIFQNSSISFVAGYQDTVIVRITNSSFLNNTISTSTYNSSLMTLRGDVTITNSIFSGNAYIWGSSRTSSGIITITNGNVTVADSKFENNKTNYQAGVFYIMLNGGYKKNINFENVLFNNNDNIAFDNSTYNAGAIYFYSYDMYQIWRLKSCTFSNNKSNGSGAAYLNVPESEIDDCIFEQNQSLSTNSYIDASSLNLQIYRTGANKASISRCQFKNNSSTQASSTLVVRSSYGYAKINQCIFQNNTSYGGTSCLEIDGGSFDVYNTLFDSNTASTANKGLFNRGTNTQSVNFYNCTFVKNQVSGSGLFTGLYPTIIANSIFWGNGSETPIKLNPYYYYNSFNISNSLVEGGFASGTNIFDTNPKFVDFAGGNYRLSCQSPLINKGSNTIGTSLFDLDATPRIFADTVDIGAYETHVDPTLANVIPAPTFTIPAEVCKDELIQSVNTTANSDNYNYQWTFGNGQRSSRISPAFSYTQSGQYTVQLTASNFCGQSSSSIKQITVKENTAPTISPVSIVCPGAEETYTTNATCQSLLWEVTGGTIVSGHNTASIRVSWGNGVSANGKVKLIATGCGTNACEVPVVVEVPIVPTQFILSGPAQVCQNSSKHYETSNKDESPATYYTWSVKGGSISSNSNKGYNLFAIDVTWGTSPEGVVYLTTYNEFLKCGKTDSFKVAITPTFKIVSTAVSEVCVNTSSFFQVEPNTVGSMNWQVTGANNTIAPYGYASWGSVEGTYKVTATPQNTSLTCTAKDTFLIHINAKPVVTALTGEAEIDLNSVHTYTANVNVPISDIDFHWSSPGATLVSSYLNTATYSRTALPNSVSVYLSTKKGNCSSNTLSLPITEKFIYTITGLDTVCIGTSNVYSSNINPAFTSDYSWTTTLNAATNTGISFLPTFNAPGSQLIELSVLSNGKTYTARKIVFVKSTPSSISVKGSPTIDPAGLQTAVYTVENPANANYDFQVVGGSVQNKTGNQYTIKWGGTAPFKITVQDKFSSPACSGVPVELVLTKAQQLASGIIASRPACINSRVTYSFTPDEFTDKNLAWSVSGGGSIVQSAANSITVEWNQTGTHTLTLTFDRFGIQTIQLPVVVNALPVPLVNPGTICGTTSFSLSTSQNYTAYNWYLDESKSAFSTLATPAIVQEGMYTVSVKDNNGCENAGSKYIKQLPIPDAKIFSLEKTSVCSEPATSTATTNILLTTFEGQDYKYEWYLDNAIIGGATNSTLEVKKPLNQSKIYAYKVKVSLETCVQNSAVQNVIVSSCNSPVGSIGNNCTEPAVAFTVDQTSLCQPFKFIVQSGQTDNLNWDFGDNSTASGLNPVKSYTKAGVYNVQLTRKCRYENTRVKVLAESVFKLDQPGCVGQELVFNDISYNLTYNKITRWIWNFGDGSGDKEFSTGNRDGRHTYTVGGTYTVSLTVVAVNDAGVECLFSSSHIYTITVPPVANFVVTAPSCASTIYTFIDKSTSAYGKATNLWTFSNGEKSVIDTTFQQFAVGNQTATLKVTDLFGCTNSKVTPFTVIAPFQIGSIKTTSKDTLLCNGRNVTLLAPLTAPGKTYAWRKVGSTTVIGTAQTLIVSTAGSYTVTYYPDASCATPVTTEAFKVNSYSVPNIISGEKLLCVGSVLTIKSNLNENTYAFSWKHNTDILPGKSADLVLNNITAADAGNYQLTVTQSTTGCFAALPVYEITVNQNPAKPIIHTDSLNVCYGTSKKINTPTIKSGNSFTWYQNTTQLSSVDTVLTTAVLTANEYFSVRVKNNATGCSTNSDNISLRVAPAISVVITGDTAVCEQVSVELASVLSAKDYIFQWFKNDLPTDNKFSKLSFSSIAKADSGTYKLQVTSLGTTNVYGCTAFSNSKTLNVKPTAPTPVITGPSEFCTGSSITLSNNLTSNSVWNTGATTQSINVQSGGIYSVISTNTISGCKITTTKIVTQNPLPDLSFVPSGVYERCGTNKIAFEGLNAYPTQSWYVNGVFFSSNKIVYPTESGKYTLKVTTAKGCTTVSDTMLINTQECACYVTNTNDSGDGSLREAINCSNDKPGKDAIKFNIVGTGPFVIKLLTALPNIKDSVVINGFTQPGLNTVGITIDGSVIPTKNGFVIDPDLANVRINGLKFTNFSNAIVLSSNVRNVVIENSVFVNNTNSAVEFNYGAQNNIVRNNNIGAGNAGISLLTGSKFNTIKQNTITNTVNGIVLKGSSNNTLRLNKISTSSKEGIALVSQSTKNTIDSNTIGTSTKDGIVLAEKSDSNTIRKNYIGIDDLGALLKNNGNGIYIAENTRYNTIINNAVAGNALNGIYIEGKRNKILNNFIGVDFTGTSKPNGTNGIYFKADSSTVSGNDILTNGDYGILVNGSNSILYGNKISNNGDGGIYIVGSKDKISRNVITNTNGTVKAIDLHLMATPGNNGKLPAEFKNYRRASGGGIVISGTSVANDSVEIFYNNNNPQQALLFAGSAKADAAGKWEVTIPAGPAFNPANKNFYVNTATNTANNTSELSTPFLTGCFACVCTVTNANDSGLGSFRAVIDSANAGGCLTINFKIASDTIQLMTAVSSVKVPVRIVTPYPADTAIFIKGAATFNGLVADNDGVEIIGLGFTGFKQAVVLNSDYNVVRNATIINSKRPLTIAGNNSSIFSSAINTTWENDASTFKADTLVYVTGSNNLIGGTGVDNKITNGKTGVLVDGGTQNRILNNAIYNNTQAIALINNGNTAYTKPAAAVGSLNGSTATIQGTAKPFDKIQIFSSTYVAEQATGFVVEVTADASGNWTATIPSGNVVLNQNNYFVATATSTTGNTSQLSAPIRVGNFEQVCYVTNTNDLGDGTLREAVNCANIAGAGTNGVPARIEFLLPPVSNEISLASKLVVTNNFGVAVNARTTQVTVKTTNTTLNCFEWATNNFKVKNITFTNFANALYCTGTNAVIDSNSFVNNTNAIYVNASDSIVQQTISNNYFAGGTSGINSIKGSLVVSANIFGKTKNDVAAPINGFGISAMHARSVSVGTNQFQNIVKNTSANAPANANGYVINIEFAKSTLTNNYITGDITTAQAAVRLYGNKNSFVAANTINTATEGIVFDRCDSVVVSQNTLTGILNRGFNIMKSNKVRLSQNTIVGLAVGKTPIDLNLSSTSNASNNSKITPLILTSTYHDGKLFLIGQAEKFDEVEVFYSNTAERDLVKYIKNAFADSTGTWIISFPISAAGSDTLFFRAVSTKTNNRSSEASVAFTPKLKICLVTVDTDAGVGSLREAIGKANANECNLIQFNIPSSGVAEINTTSVLPDITAPLLIIDGTSQPRYVTGSPTVALISTAVTGFNALGGLQLDIYGMQINNFDVAVNMQNRTISNVNDNVIVDYKNTGIKIETNAFKYGNVSNNKITTTSVTSTGIKTDGTTGLFIEKNKIFGFKISGIETKGNNQKIIDNLLVSADSTTSVGIAVINSVGVSVLQDTIRQAGTGIQITSGYNNSVLSNTIYKTDSISRANKYRIKNYGIAVKNSNNCIVSTNEIGAVANGIQIENSKGYLVYGNTANKVNNIAVYLLNAPNGEVNNNTLDSSATGMQFNGSHGVSVYNNLITRSRNYGIVLNAGSDTCLLTANLIGARYLGDPTYAEGAGILVKSSNNYIGPDTLYGLGNYIKQNKKGGVIIDGGKKNSIKYNFFYNNDITKGKPTAYAIQLINTGNNTKLKPSITSHKWIAGKLHIYGTNTGIAGDSIHVYLGTGGYEETSQFLGMSKSAASGLWEIIVDTAISNRISAKTTWYVVATATDINRNTSPLSNMYILGDCYITSLKDTTDNQYPLPNTMRMAMKCANGQANPVGIYFNVGQGGAKEVKLQMKMQDLNNGYGVQFDGKNIPDGVIAGMNAFKKYSPAWTIAETNAKSTLSNFQITNAANGLVILSDSIVVEKMRFDKITQTGISVSNKRVIIDSCVFDSLAVGIKPASNALATVLSGNTFNQTTTAIAAETIDSLQIRTSTFNTGVRTGIDMKNATGAAIESNTFKSNTATSKAIVWDNSKGLIDGNSFTAHFVENPVSILNTTQIQISNNTFKDTAAVYLLLSDVKNASVTNNNFYAASGNSIKTINTEHTTILNNRVYNARNDAFNLENSTTVFVSKNTVNRVRYTSKTDSALCINIHEGEATQANYGKQEPTRLKYEVKAGPDKRIGIFVNGLATAGDSIEVFLSDTISASMNTYMVNTITKANGTWEVKIPREFYYRDTITWYHVIAVAIDADSNTSKTSSVLNIPPSPTKIYVLNEYDAGANSLREAFLDVTYSDLYAQVIFSINLPEVKDGPYNIKIDSLFDPVYSYQGFKMDGNTQIENVNQGEDQRILVNGSLIENNFGLDIVDSSDACLLKNMWFTNTKNGMRISNDKNKIEKFYFINTDSSGVAQLDTAFVIEGKENKIKNIGISDYKMGVLFHKQNGENSFTESAIDSTNIGIVLKDSSHLDYIAKVVFTNTTEHGVLVDSAAADNKIDNNSFGKATKPVMGNAIAIKNSSNQTVTYNRISYFDPNPALASISTAITIEGKSSNNFVYSNRIGLDSLGTSLHTANVRGICIQKTADGAPSGNSLVGNEINGTQRTPIFISQSGQDLISENIIGGDSSKNIYGIDSTAIYVQNSINEQINDNIILGYKTHGIELLASSTIQMHRNTIYSNRTANKPINIHADDVTYSNNKIAVPTIRDGILTGIGTIKLTGTAIANSQVEVYQSVKDTVQAIAYIDKVFASADAAGDWELVVPKTFFSYATVNTFAAQNHSGSNSSELSANFAPTPVLCQLQNNPAITVIDPRYTPCPGPAFNLDPALDADLIYAWKAPVLADTVRTKIISLSDTTENLVLQVRDNFGCKLTRTTDVIFKGQPISPNFIVSSNVFAGDTIVLVDVSMPVPDSYTWYSSPGVTVLRSSATVKDSLIGEDGNIYPKGVRFIEFILPDSNTYTIRQTSLRDGCFVDQSKDILATKKNVNEPNPYFVAPTVQNMYTYPNPAAANQDVFVAINVSSKDKLTLTLYSILGTEIGTAELSGKLTYNVKLLGNGSTQLFTNNLSSGVYVLKVKTSNDEELVFKVAIGL
jgi:parallel beta-helix repeat protein